MGLKFQTLHGVVFSNAPLHGVKVSNLTWGCFRKWALHGIVFQTALFILEKNHHPKQQKSPLPREQQRAKALFEQSHEQQAQRAAQICHSHPHQPEQHHRLVAGVLPTGRMYQTLI